MNFFHLLESRSWAAFGIVSAQVYGPSLRHMVRVQSEKSVPPIIDYTEGRIIARIHAVAERVFAKGGVDKIIMSLAIDAMATPASIQLSTRHRAVIGGAAPNHLRYLDSDPTLLDDPDLYRAFIHSNGIDKAEEVKVAMVTLQNVPPGMPSSFMLCACPQKKNEKSTFNQDVYDSLSHLSEENDHLYL